jgi:hypothetical protein
MRLFPLITMVFGFAWILAIGFGLYSITKYEYTPGLSANPLPSWPDNTKLERSFDKATLVMIAHPHCPCTRASINELAKLITRKHDYLKTYILFLSPNHMAKGWEKTDLWQSACLIPHVKVVADRDGKEAENFHAHTSGETLLYDTDGKLLFTGGITDGRGHIGDNSGIEKIVALLSQKKNLKQKTNLVFGCSLTNPERRVINAEAGNTTTH